MKTRLISIVILLLVTLPFGCTDRIDNSPNVNPPTNNKIQDVDLPQSIDVRVAQPAECSTGGIVYVIYLDTNTNFSFDAEDSIVRKYPVCNGSNGTNGANGVDGIDGQGVAFSVVNASVSVCPAGGSTIVMATDLGNTGIYDIAAPNQQSMTVCNGQNAAVPAYTPVEPIMACGDSVAYKEVLLRLSNGQVLGSFSNDTGGTMTRLAFLPDGNFMNTDNSGCNFSLSTSSDGHTRAISWSGQVQKTWSVSY